MKFNTTDVLLLVDCQNDFLHPEGALYIGNMAANNYVDKLLELVKSFEGAIIALKDVHREGDPELELYPNHCMYQDWGSLVVEPLALEFSNRRNVYQLEKTFYSSYYVSRNIAKLTYSNVLGVSSLKVAGVLTSVCVHDVVAGVQTYAITEMNHMLDITVIRSLVRDTDPFLGEAALKRLEKLYNIKLL